MSKPQPDTGAYLLVLRLPRKVRICVGALGELQFAAGYWVYVGSAMRNLKSRIARHLRLEKKVHWHVDYLRAAADQAWALPLLSRKRRECAIARAVAARLTQGPRGFGCSDCRCATHLFHAGPLPPGPKCYSYKVR